MNLINFKIVSQLVLLILNLCFLTQAQQNSYNPDKREAPQATETITHIVTPEKIKKIELFIKQSMQQIGVPGVSVGIIEHGIPVMLKGFGVSNSNNIKVSEKTAFKLGSVSKSFTSLAVMQLHKQGKVDVNKPVVDYIPWFSSDDKTKSDQVLVKHLMNHTSGFSTIDGNRNQHSEDDSSNALKSAVLELSSVKLVSHPGKSYQYSNINYQLLGYLLEVLEGISFEQVIFKRILNPLKMTNSSVHKQLEERANQTSGHLLSYGTAKKFDDQLGRTTIAQGGIYSSAEDMLIYLSHYVKNDSPIIPLELRKQMISAEGDETPFGYGFGWYYYHQEKHRLIYHSGVSAGYETGVLFSPELDMALVVLTNSSSGFGLNNVSGIVSGVSNIILDGPARNVAAPLFETIILWSIFTIPVLIVILAFNFIRKYRAGCNKPMQRPNSLPQFITSVLLPSLLFLGIAYILLILLPTQNNAPLAAVKLFQPLVYLAVMIGASSAICWCIIRAFLLFRIKR